MWSMQWKVILNCVIFFQPIIFRLMVKKHVFGLAYLRLSNSTNLHARSMYFYKHIAYIITNKAMSKKFNICIHLILGNFYKKVLKKTRILPINIFFSLYKKTFLIFFEQPFMKATFLYRKNFFSFFYDEN